MAMDIAYKNTAGTPIGALGTREGSAYTQDYLPALAGSVLRGNCYMASSLTSAAWGGTLTATGVTWHLSNPANSGVNLVIMKGVLTVTTATTAGEVGWCYSPLGGVSTATIHGTPGVIHNCKLGISGVGGKALFDTSATLPIVPVWLQSIGWLQVTALSNSGSIIDMVMGGIVVPPGVTLSVQSRTGIGTGTFTGTWAEEVI